MPVNVTRTQTANGTSNAVPVNYLVGPNFAMSISVVVTGNATAKVQYATDDLSLATDATGTGMNWIDLVNGTLTSAITAASGNAVGNVISPVRAVRTVVSGGTGTFLVTSNFLQAGY
jgi:hypothetical protein